MNITDQEKKLFVKLTQRRQILADALEDPAAGGFKRSITDKYSDQAHFIYEILQNTDDVEATKISFKLQNKGLICSHNGSDKFTITNPDNEGDSNKKLGHINSITSIGNSSKSEHGDNEFKIGKFGVGFKSVFQYTDTPHIYDDNFWFKIERFIVPQLLDSDEKSRQLGRTSFCFPFDKPEKPPKDCLNEIIGKLKSLSNPLLFLKNLKRIHWKTDNDVDGYYVKEIETNVDRDDLNIQKIELTQKVGNGHDEIKTEYFYVFTKNIGSTDFPCSIAYRIDKDNNVLYDDQKIPAYCFFPTAAVTHLKFIIHAPFLLTDSREGIKRGNDWNNECIQAIAELTAASLLICKEYGLVSDKFFNVLPINTSDFYSASEFKPIYDQVLETLKMEELLPVNNGENHISANNSYLAESNPTEELLAFDNWQPLRDLVNNPSAYWVFSSVTDSNQKEIWEFVKNNLVKEVIDPESIARKLNKDFIEKQSDNWLVQLYGFLDYRKSTQKIVKPKPIIIIESLNREAIAVSNEENKPQVYLSSEPPHSFKTVKKCFEQDEKSLSFFKSIGITQPDVHDEMEVFIERRKNENDWDLISDFEKFLDYYINQCTESKKVNFIKSIKSLQFLKPALSDTPISADRLYQPTEDLKIFFGCEDEKQYCSVRFLDTNFYKEIYDKYNKEDISKFLGSIGVQDTPKILEVPYYIFDHDTRSYIREDQAIAELRKRFGYKKVTGYERAKDYDLDGLDSIEQSLEFIKSIDKRTQFLRIEGVKNETIQRSEETLQELESESKIRSVYLFRFLTKIEEKHYNAEYLRNVDSPRSKNHFFDSRLLSTLKNIAWLYDKHNIACKPSAITIEDLATEYDLSNASTLIKKLEFKIDDTGSSFERKLRQEFPDLSDEAILKFVKEGREREQKKKNPLDPLPPRLDDEEKITVISVVKRVSEGVKEKLERRKSATSVKVQIEEGESDDDVPLSVDLQKEIDRIEESAEEIIAQLTRKIELEETIENSEKYTFAWFKALLELESNCATEDQVKKNPIRVIFKKVEFETGTNNTIILSNTSTFIPNRIEDIGDLQLVLNSGNNVSKSVLVEVVSPQKRILKAKLKDITTLDGINLDDVESAVIEVKNADFILATLKSAFDRLPFDGKDNLQTNLPENIEFVFGPPGTGKTTYLARHEISSKVDKDKVKILVLTPTNKAADVLTKKLMEECPSHLDWLIRYGITQDNEISNSSIFKTKEIPRSSSIKLVLVTTIARFPYDSFKINNPNGNKSSFGLKDFDWDYIIFDEASMISLASIVYTIYYVNQRKPDCKFIVGGDPFQLSPVIHVAHDGWKDGNIYTLVGLDQENSFTNPQTVPHKYNVINLETQYRSIPELGTLFSEFRYNGRLSHHKTDSDINEVEIANLSLNPITIIDFKVSRFESIYKPRKVKGSNYQIYSAIFTVEFIKYIIENITILNDDLYKIGVICPYRIQSNIVDKLLAKLVNINLKKIEIISGTVHSFQGDECDMIINLLNPPLYVSDSKEIFLNKKNLLNVSISRAKDYLILLLPVDESQTIQTDKLIHIKEIRDLISSKSISSSYIERIILGEANAIEDFSFPTTHQDVNVYIEPEKKYEIRYDDNAVDIQVSI